MLQTNDISILKSIKNIFKSEKKEWWDALSDDEKNRIEEVFNQIERGEFVTYENVMKKKVTV